MVGADAKAAALSYYTTGNVAPKVAAPVAVYSQLAGGWQVGGRGPIYASKAQAEAAAAGPKPVYADDGAATFKAGMEAKSTVLAPKLTGEAKAAQAAASLQVQRDKIAKATSLTASKRKEMAAKIDKRIVDIIAPWPRLVKQRAAEMKAELTRQSNELALRNAEANARIQKERAEDLARSNAEAERQKRENPAGIDWGLLPAAAVVLPALAAVAVTGGLAAPAIAGAITVPTAASVAGALVAADRVIAAVESGSDKLGGGGESQFARDARIVLDTTTSLAASGDVSAERGLEVIARVAKDRLDKAASVGVPQPLTLAGEAAIKTYEAIKNGGVESETGVHEATPLERILSARVDRPLAEPPTAEVAAEPLRGWLVYGAGLRKGEIRAFGRWRPNGTVSGYVVRPGRDINKGKFSEG
jgi:hypothetical protein